MQIDITYNVGKSMKRGKEGYAPIVRGHKHDALFYRSFAKAHDSALRLAEAQAKTLRGNGHAVIVRLDETAGLVRV